jgi:hypothetical protein
MMQIKRLPGHVVLILPKKKYEIGRSQPKSNLVQEFLTKKLKDEGGKLSSRERDISKFLHFVLPVQCTCSMYNVQVTNKNLSLVQSSNGKSSIVEERILRFVLGS